MPSVPLRSRTPGPAASPVTDLPPRSESAFSSYGRADSAMSNYSQTSRAGRSLVQQPRSTRTSQEHSRGAPLPPSVVVPSATYIERGQRWMEKEEAVSLREAMEDMDLQRETEEARLHAAAQQEASELVWEHQNPELAALSRSPERPYSYKDHLRKNSYAHARTNSVKPGVVTPTGLARDTVYRTSTSSSSGSEGGTQVENTRQSVDSARRSGETTRKSYSGDIRGSAGRRRRSSGRRNISGEPLTTIFTGSQIWEEPGENEEDRGRSTKLSDTPAPLNSKPKNPLNRVQFVLDPKEFDDIKESTKKVSRYEIHRNPPSQSRNPAYTVNRELPAVPSKEEDNIPKKDGIEIRSEDIRQATSKSLKDRSSKLPTPAIVSDKPGRPIVSFDANWKPKEADVKPEERNHPPRCEQRQKPDRSEKSLPTLPATAAPTLPSIQLPEDPVIQVTGADDPTMPTFSFTDTTSSVPSIIVPDAPMIAVSEPPTAPAARPSSSGAARALPDPRMASSRPVSRPPAATNLPFSKGHWSLAGTRATATCHQCSLPVGAGAIRVEGHRFHPTCIICYQCGTPLAHMDLRDEPPELREPRLERIRRRAAGEILEEREGETMAEDGDERLRFYCHLDWHELFAPRCHHCKTPIEGTVQSAMGKLYHPGHFFCAECGDPFEAGMTHIEKDGYAWCVPCQTKRTERRAPKCRACKAGVVGDYVQAMGGEWHMDCFKCKGCGGDFDDRGIYPKVIDGVDVAFCVSCMEKEWKA
jgi:hypothetical protein